MDSFIRICCAVLAAVAVRCWISHTNSPATTPPPPPPRSCAIFLTAWSPNLVASAAAQRQPLLLRASPRTARWIARWDETLIIAATPLLREVKRATRCAAGKACPRSSLLWVRNGDAARPLARRGDWSDDPRERNVSTASFFARAARGEALYVLGDLTAASMHEFAPLRASLPGWESFAVAPAARGGGGASGRVPRNDVKVNYFMCIFD